MSIEHLQYRKDAGLHAFRTAEQADNVAPLLQDNALPQGTETPHRGAEFFAALSPLLDEADRLQEGTRQRETDDYLLLLEENARLRKLAVKLSNLLGDLPEQGV
jgi:hypothetical protein